MRRFRARLREWHDTAKGWRIYLVALLLALPDMLDTLAGVDINEILPDWIPGAKFSAWLALARVFLGTYIRRLPPPSQGEE